MSGAKTENIAGLERTPPPLPSQLGTKPSTHTSTVQGPSSSSDKAHPAGPVIQVKRPFGSGEERWGFFFVMASAGSAALQGRPEKRKKWGGGGGGWCNNNLGKSLDESILSSSVGSLFVAVLHCFIFPYFAPQYTLSFGPRRGMRQLVDGSADMAKRGASKGTIETQALNPSRLWLRRGWRRGSWAKGMRTELRA